MLKLLRIALLVFLPPSLFAQESIYFTHSCSFKGSEKAGSYYTFKASEEAERIVQEICNAVSLPKNFIVKSANVTNALASMEGDRRYILYSTLFLEKFKADAGTRWAAYSVLAHEIGHHLCFHDFKIDDPIKRKRMELEADRFAGGALRLLGASLDDAQRGIKLFDAEAETGLHPKGSARREAIASGWKAQDERLAALDPPPAQPSNPASDSDRDRVSAPPTTSPDATADRYTDPLAGVMIKVRGGTFQMGSNEDYGAEPVHSVTLDDYYLGETEVTQSMWNAVMGAGWTSIGQNPITQVSWDNVQAFLKKLNAQSGGGYRLPTEAEWEYAARGGGLSKNYTYSGSNKVRVVAWFSTDGTRPVKEKQPNELGFFDMSGNVWERCSDWYGPYLYGPQRNPTGPNSGIGHVIRGGGWVGGAGHCRPTFRSYEDSSNRRTDVGFRLARSK